MDSCDSRVDAHHRSWSWHGLNLRRSETVVGCAVVGVEVVVAVVVSLSLTMLDNRCLYIKEDW